MTEIVTITLQRFFARPVARGGHSIRKAAARARDVGAHRPDFADTRPVVFRSEAFAEDLASTQGVV